MANKPASRGRRKAQRSKANDEKSKKDEPLTLTQMVRGSKGDHKHGVNLDECPTSLLL